MAERAQKQTVPTHISLFYKIKKNLGYNFSVYYNAVCLEIQFLKFVFILNLITTTIPLIWPCVYML